MMNTTKKLFFMSMLMGGLFLGGITLNSCGDDDSDTTITEVPDDICNFGTCNQVPSVKEACQQAYLDCRNNGGSDSQCRSDANENCV